MFRGRGSTSAYQEAATLLQDARTALFSKTPVSSEPSNIVVTRSDAATLTLSLVGDHYEHTAATFLRIACGELLHCDRMIVNFQPTKDLGAEILNALIELLEEARTRGVAFQIASRSGTYAHDVLELFGILDWADPSPSRAA